MIKCKYGVGWDNEYNVFSRGYFYDVFLKFGFFNVFFVFGLFFFYFVWRFVIIKFEVLFFGRGKKLFFWRVCWLLVLKILFIYWKKRSDIKLVFFVLVLLVIFLYLFFFMILDLKSDKIKYVVSIDIIKIMEYNVNYS